VFVKLRHFVLNQFDFDRFVSMKNLIDIVVYQLILLIVLFHLRIFLQFFQKFLLIEFFHDQVVQWFVIDFDFHLQEFYNYLIILFV